MRDDLAAIVELRQSVVAFDLRKRENTAEFDGARTRLTESLTKLREVAAPPRDIRPRKSQPAGAETLTAMSHPIAILQSPPSGVSVSNAPLPIPAPLASRLPRHG